MDGILSSKDLLSDDATASTVGFNRLYTLPEISRSTCCLFPAANRITCLIQSYFIPTTKSNNLFQANRYDLPHQPMTYP